MLKKQGFSLIEVMLVLVIAALMMGVVASALTEGPVLRKSAREVATSMRQARSIAILQRKETIWTMDISSRQFGLALNKAEQRSLPTSIEAKVNTAKTEIVSATQGNIRFYPDGSSTGGSVELTAHGQTFKVNVEWISGRISLL
ncbi:MAG TPA: GspH/FimT family pseudopilin [Thiolinea sp.]|nr:GspH/FimT family pseudopilin [Thiolinea sp.]